MGREDQIEERDVLSSIYPDEITDLSETSYRISIALDVTPENENDAGSPPLLLTVSYPPDYPDVAPALDLTAPPNAPKFAHLDVAQDKDALLSALSPVIGDNLGMQMVFTLVSTLKDSAETLIAERQGAVQAQADAKAAAIEEAENAKFHGEKVTRERFLEWRERFRKEMEGERERAREEKEQEDKRRRVKVEEKMTGRMLWEKGLAKGTGEDEQEEEEDVGEVEKGVGSLKVEG